jgi:hypothetical protein
METLSLNFYTICTISYMILLSQIRYLKRNNISYIIVILFIHRYENDIIVKSRSKLILRIQ